MDFAGPTSNPEENDALRGRIPVKPVRSRMLAAGNTYSRKPVIRMEFRPDAGRPAVVSPEWWHKVTEGLPILPPAVLDFPDWQLAREARAPIPVVTVIELVALLLQRSMGWPVTFMASTRAVPGTDHRAGTPSGPPRGERLSAVFETRQKAAGYLAGRVALDLCDSLVRAPEDTIAAILADAFATFQSRTAGKTPHRFALWVASRAMRRGIPWTALAGQAFLRLGRGRQAELLRGLDTSLTPCIASGFAKRKDITSSLLRSAGLPIAEQRYARNVARAIAGAHDIGFPVVVKPRAGNGGKGVSVDLKTDEQVARAFELAATISPAVVIESMIKGPTFRLTVIGGRLFGVVERHPPRVQGDGASTVVELITEENRNPERQPIYIASLEPIILDVEMHDLLAEQGLTSQDVPEAGRWVLLRRVPNPPFGDKTDVTDAVHPSIRAMAERVAAVMGIHVLAIDFVATDISRPYQETGGAICEVNTFPDLGLHLKVREGTPRDAADAVLDLIYPPGKGWGFPVIVVLRDEGDGDVEGALRAEWEARGYKVGIASALARPGDTSGTSLQIAYENRLRALDLDPEADLGIVVLSPRQLVDWGLGYEAVDLAVVPAGEAASGFARRARRVLERVARGRVLALDDPDLARRTYEALALGRKLRSAKALAKPTLAASTKGSKGKAASKAPPKVATKPSVGIAPLQPRSDGDVRRARSGRLRAGEPRLFDAGNIYARRPVIELTIIGGEEVIVPAALAQTVSMILPPLSGRVPDFGGWRRVTTSTEPVPVAALVEVLAVAVQRYAGWPVRFCSWKPSEDSGSAGPERRAVSAPRAPARAVFEIATPTSGVVASRVALALASALLDGEGPDEIQAMLLQHMHELRHETVHERPHVDGLEVAREAAARGISWSVVEGSNILRLGSGRFAHMLAGSKTSQSLSVANLVAASKHTSGKILASAGFPLPRHQVARSEEEALAAARAIGFPVVVKPAEGFKGRAVSIGVPDEAGVLSAFRRAQAISSSAIIESVIPGNECRLLVVGGRFAAAVHRRPAQVRGDGTSTIPDLIERENARPERDRRLAGRAASLVPITLDDEALALLAEQGFDPTAVPGLDQTVLLRRQSNHALGGDSVDVTDAVHPSIRSMAERAATILGIDICGIDFITTDISKPIGDTGGAICEVNTRPGLKLHYGVSQGKARNVAEHVLDMLFPEGAPSRSPVVVVVGTDAETQELLRSAEKAAAKAGKILGVVTNPEGALTLAATTRQLGGVDAIGWDREVDAILVHASARQLAEHGLGLDRIDLAILTVPDGNSALAKVRDALARLSGNRVLRADDPVARKRLLAALDLPNSGRTRQKPSDTPPARTGKPPAPQPAVAIAVDPAAALPPPPSAKGRSKSSDTTVLMVGDIGFGESSMHLPRAAGLLRILDEQGYGYSLAKLQDLLSSADLVIGNLEVPLSSRPDIALQNRKKNLGWSDPERTVAALRQAGIGAVSLANNHALDCGASGLEDTLARLKEAGITSFGAGPDLAAADQPLIWRFTVGGQERSLVVFGSFEHRDRYKDRYRWYARPQAPGVSRHSAERIATTISVLRNCLPAPVFVAYPHWGDHYTGVNDAQRDEAIRLIEAGVDLIIGHGAHTAQAVETVAGRPVVFGLGNFVWNTPGRYNRFGAPPYSLVAAIVFHGKRGKGGISLRLFPILTDNRITNFQSRPVTKKEFADALAVVGQSVKTQLIRRSAKTWPYLEINVDGLAKSPASGRIEGAEPTLRKDDPGAVQPCRHDDA